jgi:hypothetical protein
MTKRKKQTDLRRREDRPHDDGEDHSIPLQAPVGECEPPVERVEDHAEEHEACKGEEEGTEHRNS